MMRHIDAIRRLGRRHSAVSAASQQTLATNQIVSGPSPARRGRISRRLLAPVFGLAVAGAFGGACLATPSAASAAVVSRTAAAAVSYGETAQFHCSYGEVTLDNMRLPNAELPVTWQAAVYRYTASGWVYYKTMYTASGYSAETVSNPVQNVYYQQPMYAGVPDGSYYAVLVYVVPNASLGYQPHYDWGQLSYGYGTGTYCIA